MTEQKQVSSRTYRKLFISDVHKESSIGHERKTSSSMNLKVAILGVIVGVKAYSERNLYMVDDGTGILDCSIKVKDPTEKLQISQLKEELLLGGCSSSNVQIGVHSILNRLENNLLVEEKEYVLGDAIVAYGYIRLFNNKPRFEIQHHSKVDDPNMEHDWIFRQLLLYRDVYNK